MQENNFHSSSGVSNEMKLFVENTGFLSTPPTNFEHKQRISSPPLKHIQFKFQNLWVFAEKKQSMEKFQ